MFDKFTHPARKVMTLARNASDALKHNFIGTEHILIGLIDEDESIAAAVLRDTGIKSSQVKDELTTLPSENSKAPGTLPFTPGAKRALEATILEAADMRHNYVGPEHILLGIINNEEDQKNEATKILIKLGIDIDLLRNDTHELIGDPIVSGIEEEEQEQNGSSKSKRNKNKPVGKALTQFGRDLTQLAKDNVLDPVIGRLDEMERTILILARRTKNNPILLGEPGVGKTAIVEGIAQQIIKDNIPDILKDHKIIALDLAAMVAGTKYRGQFEERIKAVMNEASNSKIILFIDEIHTLIGAGGAEGAIDAANVLKPALSRGEIRCIGATTVDEYRKSLEKDGALARRFQRISIEPSTTSETENILFGLLDRYQIHHKVSYTDDAVKSAVNLSNRYITNRFLPDKAIDVIDEAGARAMLDRNRPKELKDTEIKIKSLNLNKEEAVAAQDFEKAAELRDEIDQLIKKIQNRNIKWNKESNEYSVVTKELIAITVAKMTGIPVAKMSASETDKFLNLEAELSKIIIGQNKPKKIISKALRRTRAGLGDPKRPIGCFLLVGPTGVGKTLICKALAQTIFNSNDALITLDMSEFSEKFTVSRLVGASPGYVGYQDAGQLTEAVRNKPYSIILFDEIEKAHPDIFNILLQIMEEGKLTDAMGREVNFKNTIIILTSNVGSEFISNKSPLGFGRIELDKEKMIENQLSDSLSNTFKPEFLNRLDEKPIIFTQLTKDDLEKIIDIELNKVRMRLQEKNIKFKLTGLAREFLLKKGWNPDFGARPLRRAVSTYIEDTLAEYILSGKSKENSIIVFDKDVNEEKLLIIEE